MWFDHLNNWTSLLAAVTQLLKNTNISMIHSINRSVNMAKSLIVQEHLRLLRRKWLTTVNSLSNHFLLILQIFVTLTMEEEMLDSFETRFFFCFFFRDSWRDTNAQFTRNALGVAGRGEGINWQLLIKWLKCTTNWKLLRGSFLLVVQNMQPIRSLLPRGVFLLVVQNAQSIQSCHVASFYWSFKTRSQ